MKKEIIRKITKEEIFSLEKPRYNAYQGGHGAFTNKKYDKKQIRRQNKKLCQEI